MKCPKCHFKNPDDSIFCSKCGTQIHSFGKISLDQAETIKATIEEIAAGSTFAGRYQIIEELGRGGMGRVYKALDKEINEQVALKLLNPEVVADENTVERFRNELKFARKISHRNVCRMYHFSEEEETKYIIMEYVRGEDLKSTIRRVGQLSVGKAVFFAKQVCEGLAEAHRLGVVHRDLKPQNIMVDSEGNARIMDFGIARSLKAKGITVEGVIIGTPDYMSPEQAEGKKVDPRSDIYALGVILFEMITGRVPFEGDTPLSVIVKHKSELPPDPKEVNALIPEELSRVILKCLEKDKERRYQGAKELLSDLTKIEKVIPTTERIRVEKTKKIEMTLSQKIKLKWAAAIIIIGLVLIAGYPLWRGLVLPPVDYENFILLEVTAHDSQEIPRNLVEYLLLRSMTASTKLNVLIQEDFTTYKKKTETEEERPMKPLIAITGDVYPKVTGFEILISLRVREKTKPLKKFECKGPFDLISNKIEEINSFLSTESDGVIGKIEKDRTFSQICTDNLDAMNHFLKGEDAWRRLDSETAYFEYRTAIENDSGFSLAHLKLADVLLFRGDREEAKESLQVALKNKDKLIEYDLLRLKALRARINFNPREERQYIGQLTEVFPFKKEYHYEFAESYFNCGEADEAIIHYAKALDLDPDYSLAHNHIAFCYSWIGNHRLAEDHFKKYVELDMTANSYDSLASGYMFAGKYDEAIKALHEGKELDPNLDYLYGNLANNLILKGVLYKAAEVLNEEIAITERNNTKINAQFYSAFIEFLRGDFRESIQKLKPVRDFYSSEIYMDRVDESPNLPFWLAGVIAYEKNDSSELSKITKWMEKKFSKYEEKTQNEVNATNYFPIFKFYIHLKILEAHLKKNEDEILKYIDEGKRIRKKMGYWGSMFNMSYFFDKYAEVFVKMNKLNEALELLNEVVEYNSNYASSHINLAKIHLKNNNMDEARAEHQKALDLLADADKDFILVKEVKKIEREIEKVI